MDKKTVLGVDMGATNIRATKVNNDEKLYVASVKIENRHSENDVLQQLIETIKQVFDPTVQAIGVGVPSVVDIDRGIVYDVQNIPSWQEVHLKEILEENFSVPVYVNNDANCFVLGEKYFGNGQSYQDIIGLTLGTGMGTGLILNNKLYAGKNCGAGEFGMIPYLDHNYEYYCSGQFFKFEHNREGDEVYLAAQRGEHWALKIYADFGSHLGQAINTILFALDPQIIILGGSVSKGFKFFQETMWEAINNFPFALIRKRLKIIVSQKEHVALLGAAGLCYEMEEQFDKQVTV